MCGWNPYLRHFSVGPSAHEETRDTATKLAAIKTIVCLYIFALLLSLTPEKGRLAGSGCQPASLRGGGLSQLPARSCLDARGDRGNDTPAWCAVNTFLVLRPDDEVHRVAVKRPTQPFNPLPGKLTLTLFEAVDLLLRRAATLGQGGLRPATTEP